MGYYMGDFYAMRRQRMPRGDYYRGDPFFGALLGLAKKVGGSLLGKFHMGGGATKVIEQLPASPMGRLGEMVRTGAGRLGKVAKKHPVLTGAAGAGALAGAAGLHHMLGGGRGGHRRRRMNVCNPRALRKAIRRTHGFAKLAMRTIHLVHPKKKARFGGFKKRRAHK